jgi:hypothetical protein
LRQNRSFELVEADIGTLHCDVSTKFIQCHRV